jgi:hypothetical protein
LTGIYKKHVCRVSVLVEAEEANLSEELGALIANIGNGRRPFPNRSALQVKIDQLSASRHSSPATAGETARFLNQGSGAVAH